ncbi:MAG: hypothetical protein VX633_13145 [Verrucomicrobiota bacterium]|nr:hypothetical protein [Verrucomicrobiota bacterium]
MKLPVLLSLELGLQGPRRGLMGRPVKPDSFLGLFTPGVPLHAPSNTGLYPNPKNNHNLTFHPRDLQIATE